VRFFLSLEHEKVYLTSQKIEQSFIFSMMTIINETRDMGKYDYLDFVEFLEFICRLAICGMLEADLV